MEVGYHRSTVDLKRGRPRSLSKLGIGRKLGVVVARGNRTEYPVSRYYVSPGLCIVGAGGTSIKLGGVLSLEPGHLLIIPVTPNRKGRIPERGRLEVGSHIGGRRSESPRSRHGIVCCFVYRT